jgi:hypothetical protein
MKVKTELRAGQATNSVEVSAESSNYTSQSNKIGAYNEGDYVTQSNTSTSTSTATATANIGAQVAISY